MPVSQLGGKASIRSVSNIHPKSSFCVPVEDKEDNIQRVLLNHEKWHKVGIKSPDSGVKGPGFETY